MTGSDELASLLNQGFNGLEDKAQQCIDKFNAAVHHITDWRFVLGPALFVIRPAIDKIREDLEKLVKLIRTAVDHHMPVVSLIVQSFNWVDHVQAPVNLLTHEDSHLRYYWEGIASSATRTRSRSRTMPSVPWQTSRTRSASGSSTSRSTTSNI